MRYGSAKGVFLSGFIASGFSVGNRGYGNAMSRTMIMAVVGGTAAVVGGGKFANGALTAAFVHMFNAEGLTIRQTFSKLFDRSGEIWEDVKQGIDGGINGYREVRDHAPSGVKIGLQVVMTVTETGLTWGFVSGFKEIYDFTSGMFFDTSPLASKASIAGFYTKQYIDAFYSNKNYELKNLIPINY